MGKENLLEDNAARVRMKLAECLFNADVKMDPFPDGVSWATLSRDDRDFYRLSIEHLESAENLWIALFRLKACEQLPRDK